MGGGDKALLMLAGRPLMGDVIARLKAQCTPHPPIYQRNRQVTEAYLHTLCAK